MGMQPDSKRHLVCKENTECFKLDKGQSATDVKLVNDFYLDTIMSE